MTRRVALGLLGGVLLAGCLPRHAITRRDEVEATLYALDLDVDVVTEGLDIEPFRWHVDGTVGWSYARTFRDGSMGHLVYFKGMKARIERGDQRVGVPVPWADAALELRGFPDGEVLLVSGETQWSGTNGHLELLDVLWPALSPHLPASRAEAAELVTSWPAWVEGGPKVRNRLKAAWKPKKSTWSYEGTLHGEGGYVRSEGSAKGEVTQGEGGDRLHAHAFDWTRTVRTTWPAGAEVAQTFTLRGSLTHVGTEAAPLLDMPVASDDASADALPLRLRDGRSAADAGSDLTATTPFLFLPDDLGPDARGALRTRVVGTW